ncbi:MAG: hypothetical protein Q8Q32_02970 [bacterium]|nr:hypothetical protein [bacterium]
MEGKDQKIERGELQALVKKRDSHVSRLFYMMLEFFLIFGLPALAAFFGGRALDSALGTGKLWLIIFLIAAFVLSWVIVVLRVRKITKELKVLDARIKEIRESRKTATAMNAGGHGTNLNQDLKGEEKNV